MRRAAFGSSPDAPEGETEVSTDPSRGVAPAWPPGAPRSTTIVCSPPDARTQQPPGAADPDHQIAVSSHGASLGRHSPRSSAPSRSCGAPRSCPVDELITGQHLVRRRPAHCSTASFRSRAAPTVRGLVALQEERRRAPADASDASRAAAAAARCGPAVQPLDPVRRRGARPTSMPRNNHDGVVRRRLDSHTRVRSCARSPTRNTVPSVIGTYREDLRRAHGARRSARYRRRPGPPRSALRAARTALQLAAGRRCVSPATRLMSAEARDRRSRSGAAPAPRRSSLLVFVSSGPWRVHSETY